MRIILMAMALLWGSPVAADVAAQVSIDRPFARSALQLQRNTTVYMEVTNHGASAAIVSASSPAADVVELHTHIEDRGVLRMRRIPRIELPNGKPVDLRPGGLHVMLIGLRRDLNVGEQIAVTLQFSDGSQRDLKVPVHRVMRP